MKIERNITMYVGEQPAGADQAGADKERENRKTVFAGNLNQDMTLQDRIAQRKSQAKEQAMKIVGDVFEADRALDTDMENRRARVKELGEDRKTLQEQKADVMTEREGLKKALEAGDVGEEEYARMSVQLDEAEKECDRKLDENEAETMQENAIIRGTRLERLKKDPMVRAQKEAEEVLQAARDEIVGMAYEDGKDRVDEEAAKRQEQAEEIKEEREEREEFIEEQKEKREEIEELLENLPVTEMLGLDKLKSDVQQEVQEILNKMKLVAEDIKGAAVDESL